MKTEVTYDVQSPTDLAAVAAERVRERDFLHYIGDNWRIDHERALDIIAPHAVATSGSSDGFGIALIDHGKGGLMTVNVSRSGVGVSAAAATRERASELVEEARSWLPPAVRTPEDSRASVTFWSYGTHGPNSVHRLIDAPRWREIDANYSDEARSAVARMMARDGWDESEGQLILWQGEPGTGKTFALRALAREWATFCDFHYIVDPDRFFGAHTDYMLEVILSDSGDPVPVDDDFDIDIDNPESFRRKQAKKAERWKLLILEDAGELLAKDARVQVGPALSRLLNAVDGMIGQGLRLLILVTTNEEMGALHPAIRRSGRAAERVTFESLDLDAAREWLKERGDGEVEIHEAQTIADLYARLRDPDHDREPAPRRRAGFLA